VVAGAMVVAMIEEYLDEMSVCIIDVRELKGTK